MVSQQPGRAGPVARRLGVPDGVDHLAMLSQPLRRPQVQRRDLLGQRPTQLQTQQITEQMVVTEPGPLRVQRHHERVRILQIQQDPF
jgi:hypothetical protein